MQKKHFDFGENWKNFTLNSLDDNKFIDAKESLISLLGKNNIKGRSFLDIGAGSGLFSIAANLLDAKKVVGFDISKNSIDTCYINKERFAKESDLNFYEQSVLAEGYDRWGKFDIVYSWGVLHHTGSMWKAIDNSMSLVNDGGLFAIAIYNKHWSSFSWKIIKWFYNVMPGIIKKIMIVLFYWIIAFAKLLATRKNPFSKKKRGMDYYYNVVDWVGGYPYEYASKKEIIDYFNKNGFEIINYVETEVPTGCNEFVFRKTA